MTDTIQNRLQAAYEKVKFFPEDSPTGWIDFIALRQCAADALLEMAAQTREIARLEARIAVLEGNA
jgi:hypothetical protein